jgi:hypothetical protein
MLSWGNLQAQFGAEYRDQGFQEAARCARCWQRTRPHASTRCAEASACCARPRRSQRHPLSKLPAPPDNTAKKQSPRSPSSPSAIASAKTASISCATRARAGLLLHYLDGWPTSRRRRMPAPRLSRGVGSSRKARRRNDGRVGRPLTHARAARIARHGRSHLAGGRPQPAAISQVEHAIRADLGREIFGGRLSVSA